MGAQELRRLYDQGLTDEKISEALHIPTTRVWSWRKGLGLPSKLREQQKDATPGAKTPLRPRTHRHRDSRKTKPKKKRDKYLEGCTRERAGMTQRAAAERLHIGIRTLRGYELGDVQPSPETALAMGRVYRRPEFTAMYCHRECAIGQAYSYMPKVVSLEIGFLRLLKEFKDVQQRLESEIGKVSNGKFSNDTLRELLELEHAIETLKLSCAEGHSITTMIRQHNEKIAS